MTAYKSSPMTLQDYMEFRWEMEVRIDELEEETFQRYLEYLRNPDPNPVFSGLDELIFTGYADE